MAYDPYVVRILIGDSDETLLTADQLSALGDLYGNNNFTVAAAAARAIAAKYGGSVTKKSGDVSINSSDKYAHYMSLAKDLDRQAALRGLDGASVYAGGISVGDKETRESDDDRVQPFFTRERFDNPNIDNTDTLGTL